MSHSLLHWHKSLKDQSLNLIPSMIIVIVLDKIHVEKLGQKRINIKWIKALFNHIVQQKYSFLNEFVKITSNIGRNN